MGTPLSSRSPTLPAVSSLALPLGIVLGTAAVLHGPPLPERWRAAAELAPPLALAAGVLLGARFNRSRAVFAVLVLAAADLALRFTRASPDDPRGAVVRDALAVLVPLCLAAVSAFGERGLLTRHGVARVVALLVPLPLVWWLAQPPQEALASLLRAPVLSLQPPAWTSLTAAGCTAYAVATAVLVARLVVHRSPVDAGLIGALAGSALGLDAAARVPDSTAYLTAGATALVVALVQESHRLAYLDELTRLPGRRALDEEMAKLGGRYAVAMLDVDHFKSFNDTYGHDVGDQVLRLVASRIASGEGRAFRYGGEEFTVLFPGCSAREALPHLERVRAAVEAARMTLRGPDRPVRKPRRQRSGAEAARHRDVSVTISIGVADRTDERRTPEEVREAADRALYRAKEQGRNQVNLAAAGPARRRSGSR